jgi:hypothetical protein
LTIHAPSSALNARGAADLAIQADLIWIIAATIFAIFVVGFASDAVLSGGKHGDYAKNKGHSEKAENVLSLMSLLLSGFADSADPGRAT